MKYKIKSLDTVRETDKMYLVVEFRSDAGELLRVEDFVIGRPAMNRRYAGPPLYDKNGNWLGEVDAQGNPIPPDPSLWVTEKNDVAAEIDAVLSKYIDGHPEMEDASKRDSKYKVDTTDKSIQKDKSDPAGHLSDPAILAMIGKEKIKAKVR